MMGLVSANTIPFSKLSISNISSHGTYIPLVVGNQYVAGKLTPALLTSISDSGLGCVGYENLSITGSQPTDTQIISYDSSAQKLKWISQSSALALARGEVQVGSYTNDNSVVKLVLANNANILDTSLYTTNTQVPINLVYCTDSSLTNVGKWKKISHEHLNSSNTPSANQVLSWSGSQLAWVNQGTSSPLLFSQFNFNQQLTNYSRFEVVYDTSNNATCPIIRPPNSTQVMRLAVSTNRTPAGGYQTFRSELCGIIECIQGEASGIMMSTNEVTLYSPVNYNRYVVCADEDSFSAGAEPTAFCFINISGSIQVVSDEQKKKEIAVQNRQQDLDYCYNALDSIDVIKYKYNILDEVLQKCKSRLCACKNEEDCQKKQVRLIKKCAMIHYGFSAQQIEATGLKKLTNKFEHNYDENKINEYLADCCDGVKSKYNESKAEEVADHQKQKTLSTSQLITVLVQVNKKQKQLINSLENRLTALEQRLTNAGIL